MPKKTKKVKIPKYSKHSVGDIGRVEKIDSEKFDVLKTGINNIESLKNVEKSKLKQWYRHFEKQLKLKDLNNILWVSIHWSHIVQYINDKSLKWSPASRRMHLDALSNILLSIDKNKFRELTRKFWNEGRKIQEKREVTQKDNIFKKKDLDNFVCFDDLVKKRNEYLQLWNAKPEDLQTHMYYLILSLNTFAPPLRLDTLNMNITQGGPKPKKDNHMWEYSADKWAMIINVDKVSSKIGCARFDLSEELPKMPQYGEKLNQIISRSVKILPRKYLITSIKNKDKLMSSNIYRSSLHNIFSPLKPSHNGLRKAFVNHFYRLSPSENHKIMWAHRMRHSVSSAEKDYKKININHVVKVLPAEVKVKPIETKKKPKDIRISQTEYRNKPENKEKLKKWRQDNKMKVNRNKLIWTYNNGFAKPRKTTLDKYNIKYDEDTKRYIAVNL